MKNDLLIIQRNSADTGQRNRLVKVPADGSHGVLIYSGTTLRPVVLGLGSGLAVTDGQLTVTVAAGETGAAGPQGIQGVKGNAGSPGVSPVLGIGSVTTLAPGVAATAAITGPQTNLILSLGIPTGSKGDPGAAGVSYAPQTPIAITPTINTAYQHADKTKPYRITVNSRSALTVTLVALAVTDKVELRIAPTAAGALANGSGGFSVGVWETGITGISVTVGMGLIDGGQLSAEVPAGWFYSINRLAGTSATIVSAFTQSLSA